jgi:hypothetical protein
MAKVALAAGASRQPRKNWGTSNMVYAYCLGEIVRQKKKGKKNEYDGAERA